MTFSGRLTIVRDQSSNPTELYAAKDILDFETGLHFHPEIQFVFVIEGQRRFFFQDRDLTLNAGDCLIIPPYLPHRGASVSDAPTAFNSLYISQTHAQRFPALKDFANEDRPAAVMHCQAFAHRFVENVSNGKDGLESIYQLLDALEMRTSPQIACTRAASGKPAASSLARARAMLISQIKSPPSLDVLANRVGISKFHFTRQFSRIYGMSPHAFNLRCRLNLAKSLLANGEDLSAIANDLGFFDQSHFGLHFRRVVGLTPAVYQRSLVTE